jgi:hypothetical protein
LFRIPPSHFGAAHFEVDLPVPRHTADQLMDPVLFGVPEHQQADEPIEEAPAQEPETPLNNLNCRLVRTDGNLAVIEFMAETGSAFPTPAAEQAAVEQLLQTPAVEAQTPGAVRDLLADIHEMQTPAAQPAAQPKFLFPHPASTPISDMAIAGGSGMFPSHPTHTGFMASTPIHDDDDNLMLNFSLEHVSGWLEANNDGVDISDDSPPPWRLPPVPLGPVGPISGASSQTPLLEQMRTVIKSAKRNAEVIVEARKPHPTIHDQRALYQYIIIHCTVLLGMPRKAILNFTLYDFVNKEQDNAESPVTFRIRKALQHPFGFHTVTMSASMYGILVYYFNFVRPEWLAKSKTANSAAVLLPFRDPVYYERTAHFFVNSAGNHKINPAQTLQVLQKKLIVPAGVSGVPALTLANARKSHKSNPQMKTILEIGLRPDDIQSSEKTLAELYPISIDAETDLPTIGFLASKLQEKSLITETEATAKARTYWKYLWNLRINCRVKATIEQFPREKPTLQEVTITVH